MPWKAAKRKKGKLTINRFRGRSLTSRNSGSIFLRGHEVVEIAEKLRYNNSQNFIRVFKRINGTTPGEFRLLRGSVEIARKPCSGRGLNHQTEPGLHGSVFVLISLHRFFQKALLFLGKWGGEIECRSLFKFLVKLCQIPLQCLVHKNH